VVLAIIAISITAIVVARVVADASKTTINSGVPEGIRLSVTDPDANQAPSGNPTLSPSQSNADRSQADGNRFTMTLTETGAESAGPLDQPAAKAVYEYAPFTLPITWGAVAGTVIWRGRVRAQWSKQGYDYDTFRLVIKMRGSPTRQKLLEAVKSEQKNKLQLANELGVDWKTVDNHVGMLLEARLVEERNVVGTARYYSITENGVRVLALLAESEPASGRKVDGGDEKLQAG
jgi:DNA-binding transcriptional ArsR family regulator